MQMTETLQNFILGHAEDDVSQLLLNASRYKNINIKAAVEQIIARRQIKDKLPSWHNDSRLFYPSTLAAEQCSSEKTAKYKQRLVSSDDVLCDLTGGLGVDSYFFSQKVRHVTYVEQDEKYCDAARYNMEMLGASDVCVVNGNAVELATNNDRRVSDANVFYIDPARRGKSNKRMFAISDCEPDITKIWTFILNGSDKNPRDKEAQMSTGLYKQNKVIVKLSPMLDISHVLSQLPEIDEVHVVSVKNDCKELLIVASSGGDTCSINLSESVAEQRKGGRLVDFPKNDAEVFCVNYTSEGTEQLFTFKLSEEHTASVSFATKTGKYLYEPNASILKAGAYKSVALRYGVEKLHVNSHLYTSDDFIPLFPGRIFEIADVIPFGNQSCKNLSSEMPQANITARNFPLSVEDLRKRTRIVDGGDTYLFATILSDNKKVLIKCRKAGIVSIRE